MKARPQKPRRSRRGETAGVTGEEHSDRSTVNEDADHTVGDDHQARCIHAVVEKGSVVLQVSNNMSEVKKRTVKKQARQKQQKRLKRFQKTCKIRRLIEERRRTRKEEKRLKEVRKLIKNVSQTKKESIDSKTSKEYSKTPTLYGSSQESIQQIESAHHKR